MNLRNKLTTGIVTITIATTMFASSAYAQTQIPTPVPAPTPVVTYPSLSASAFGAPDGKGGAQASKAACAAFSGELLKDSGGRYKTEWNASPAPYDANVLLFGSYAGNWYDSNYIKCFVALANDPDPEDPSKVSTAATSTQNLILGSPQGPTSVVLNGSAGSTTQNDEASWYSQAIGFVISGIATIISGFLNFIVALAGKIMLSAINNTIGLGSNQPKIVTVGWTVVRDLMNMFFILALIVMSIATILRNEQFAARKFILKLIMMALLINFSLVISTTIISLFDSLIKLFMPANGFKDLLSALVKITWDGFATYQAGAFTSAVSGLAVIFFNVILLGVFLALTGLFVIRMVGLYMLLILSPAAYALSILPGQPAALAKQWWQYFFKYLTWGPSALFFVWLAFYMTKMGGTAGIGIPDSTFTYVIIVGFLWGAVIVAKKTGMVGANYVTKYAEQGAKGIGKYVARGSYVGSLGNQLAKRDNAGAQWIGKKLQAVPKITAVAEGAPGAVRAKFKELEGNREKLVKEETRMTQIKLGKAGGFSLNADTAKGLKPNELRYLLEKGRIGEKEVGTIMEHGGNSQKMELVKGLRDNLITGDAAQTLRTELWQAHGGKDKEPPKDFMIPIKRKNEEGQFLDQTGKVVDSEDKAATVLSDTYEQRRDQEITKQKIFIKARKDKKKDKLEKAADNEREVEGGRGSGKYKQTPGFGGGSPAGGNSGGGNASTTTTTNAVGQRAPQPTTETTTVGRAMSSVGSKPMSQTQVGQTSGSGTAPSRRQAGFTSNLQPQPQASAPVQGAPEKSQTSQVRDFEYQDQPEAEHETETIVREEVDRDGDSGAGSQAMNEAADALKSSADAIKKSASGLDSSVKDSSETLRQTFNTQKIQQQASNKEFKEATSNLRTSSDKLAEGGQSIKDRSEDLSTTIDDLNKPQQASGSRIRPDRGSTIPPTINPPADSGINDLKK